MTVAALIASTPSHPWATHWRRASPIASNGDAGRSVNSDTSNIVVGGNTHTPPQKIGVQIIGCPCNSSPMGPDADLQGARPSEPTQSATPDTVGTSTMSGIPLEPVYGVEELGAPGEYPYTRGPYRSMYRTKLW